MQHDILKILKINDHKATILVYKKLAKVSPFKYYGSKKEIEYLNTKNYKVANSSIANVLITNSLDIIE